MPIPLPPQVAAAGVKSAGSVTSALIGRYRPSGVPRTGSREDRADASTRSFAYTYMNNHMKREAGWAAYGYLKGQMPQGWEISAELLASLFGVRLCGTPPVIAAAEDMVNAAGDMNFGEKNAEVFQKAADTFTVAQRAFLNAARTDLAYDARWWQVARRLAERKFLRAHARAAVASPGPRAAVGPGPGEA